MELNLLTKAELTALYRDHLLSDFPKSELKPLKGMLNLMDHGVYDPLLVTDNGQPVGYALLWLPHDRRGALLEYFGVLRGLRNNGLGARILDLLTERYGQLFGEAEAPTSADPAENDLRRRRIGFYERCGFRVLDYECALFGVHFNCLYCGPQTDDRAVEAMHRGVYAAWFSGGHMERYIQIPLKPGEAIIPAPEWVEEEDVLDSV
jgi:ribosomal protein S18 acetylase RimI-like enzyme